MWSSKMGVWSSKMEVWSSEMGVWSSKIGVWSSKVGRGLVRWRCGSVRWAIISTTHLYMLAGYPGNTTTVNVLLQVVVQKLKHEIQFLVQVQDLVESHYVWVTQFSQQRDLTYGGGRNTLKVTVWRRREVEGEDSCILIQSSH